MYAFLDLIVFAPGKQWQNPLNISAFQQCLQHVLSLSEFENMIPSNITNLLLSISSSLWDDNTMLCWKGLSLGNHSFSSVNFRIYLNMFTILPIIVVLISREQWPFETGNSFSTHSVENKSLTNSYIYLISISEPWWSVCCLWCHRWDRQYIRYVDQKTFTHTRRWESMSDECFHLNLLIWSPIFILVCYNLCNCFMSFLHLSFEIVFGC